MYQTDLPTAQAPVTKTQNARPVLGKAAGSAIWLAVWLVVLGLTFAWRAQNLDAFGLSNDEGVYLMWARLAAEGYPLYSHTYAVQPPLFLEGVRLAFYLGGTTIQTGRWAIMLAGYLPLAVVLSWLAHRSGGWPAALLALVLLGVSPLVFVLSRLVMAEIPATALAVTSLSLLIWHAERPHKGRLLASGLALGLSLITKTLYPFVAVPAGLLVVWPYLKHNRRGRSFRLRPVFVDLLVWAVGVCLPAAAMLLVYPPAALYDQLVAFRGDLRAAIPGSWPETWSQFDLFLKSHWGFWLLAFGGIIAGVFSIKGRGAGNGSLPQNLNNPVVPAGPGEALLWLWPAWLAAGSLMLAWHTPLFPHHFVMLLPPLITLGAGFIGQTVTRWRLRAGSLYTRLLCAAVVLAAGLNLPSMVKANQHTAAIVTGGREQEALALLQAVSGPNDFVMGDSQLLIFMANRRTPPPMGDVALVAIKAGRQTSPRMVALTQAYRSPAVVQWSLRLPWLPDYLAWVEQNYLARRVWDNDHIIYFAPRFPAGQTIPHQSSVRLGEHLVWRGYELVESPPEHHRLNLRVYWQADAPPDGNYTVFTQLLDSRGRLVAGWDSQPLGGYFPTGQWPANQIITDVVQFPLPDDLPAGEYTLVTGMYLLETLERLRTPSGEDHIVLTTIRIK